MSLGFFDRKGAAELLKVPPRPYEHPRLSPDGKQIAFVIDDGKAATIWIYELSGASAVRRLTFDGQGNNRFPVWSADSQRVTFQSDREKDLGIFWQRADGAGAAERLVTAEPDPQEDDAAEVEQDVVEAGLDAINISVDAAGKETFFRSVEQYLDALLLPDYTDEEIRRAHRRTREIYGQDSLVVCGLYDRERLSLLLDEASFQEIGAAATALNPQLPASPPKDTKGNTATTARGVGAHQLHLNAGALSAGVSCAECHKDQSETYGASIHGQERVDATVRLCRMNLAIHGLEADIRKRVKGAK